MNLPRYLEIDLSSCQVKEYPVSAKVFELYLGGKALAAKILYDRLKPGINPLSADNILIVNTGPLNGTGAPSSSRFNVSTKNVLTGGIASSNCGGTFGVKMRRAGVDGLIITGKAKGPCYIELLDGDVTVKEAAGLWGLDTEETQHRFDRRYGALVIGPAGENLVNFACAVSGERVAGRCGVGAVMGSKNLKAIVAYGTQPIPVHQPDKLREFSRKWIDFLKGHPTTGKALALYGTAGSLNKCNALGILPTRNFQKGTWEEADKISGHELAENHLTRNSGCVSCPIRCERRVKVKDKEVKGPEFETLGLFGSNIENSNLALINEWNYHADLLGMDTISLGGALAFAMELAERGIKDFGLRFGDASNIRDVIHKIARREGQYSELADGVKVLSEKYGGRDFAIHSKGLELASYDPRKAVGQGLGYATANRGGCHLNGGYVLLLEAIGAIPVDPVTTKGKPELTSFYQNGTEACSTAGLCLFTGQATVPGFTYKLKPSSKILGLLGGLFISSRFILRLLCKWPKLMAFHSMALFPQARAIELATGIKMTMGRYVQLGERSFNMERLFNIREGICGGEDKLPERLTSEPIEEHNPDTLVKLAEMLPKYYKVRGWDENGIPTERKLRQLGILA